jgi:hypothetical protein
MASGNAYAFWTGSPAPDDTASVGLSTPTRDTYVGVMVRGTSSVPFRDHYAAFVDPSGRIHLARRNNYSYTFLGDGPAFPSGSHELSLTATGSGPVVLSVVVDQTEVIHSSDVSSGALTSTGKAGIFDYNGAGQPLDHFSVVGPDSPTGGGSTGGSTGGVSQFLDPFVHSGALGSDWLVRSGTWTSNGSAAQGSGNAYAFWIGTPAADDTVTVTLESPIRSTWVGAITRGSIGSPERNHYAAFVAPDGAIHLARRNDYVYHYLADGPEFPDGNHQLSIAATGAGPVTLSVLLDGAEILRYVDTSPEALNQTGSAGMFDYSGSGQSIDTFQVVHH